MRASSCSYSAGVILQMRHNSDTISESCKPKIMLVYREELHITYLVGLSSGSLDLRVSNILGNFSYSELGDFFNLAAYMIKTKTVYGQRAWANFTVKGSATTTHNIHKSVTRREAY